MVETRNNCIKEGRGIKTRPRIFVKLKLSKRGKIGMKGPQPPPGRLTNDQSVLQQFFGRKSELRDKG